MHQGLTVNHVLQIGCQSRILMYLPRGECILVCTQGLEIDHVLRSDDINRCICLFTDADLVREQASRRAGEGVLPCPARAIIMRREDDLGVSDPCRPIAVRPLHHVTLLLQHMQQRTPARVPNAARGVLGRAQDACAAIRGAHARHLPCVPL